ncbi:MAG: hypothetical protein EOM59_19140 [Clostridia bacterium]|nr:hypothetical protein [Clostridia bacterium]
MKSKSALKILLLASFCLATAFVSAQQPQTRSNLQVFYKEKKPSLKTLARTKELLKNYEDRYEIQYLIITDPANQKLIEEIGLPGTHFPFAIAFNGKTTASIDGRTITFCEFPDFMHGIGRHEGNWSLAHLQKVLDDNQLLMPKNILPSHDEADHHDCEGDSHDHGDTKLPENKASKDKNFKAHQHNNAETSSCDGDCSNCQHQGNCPENQ